MAYDFRKLLCPPVSAVQANQSLYKSLSLSQLDSQHHLHYNTPTATTLQLPPRKRHFNESGTAVSGLKEPSDSVAQLFPFFWHFKSS